MRDCLKIRVYRDIYIAYFWLPRQMEALQSQRSSGILQLLDKLQFIGKLFVGAGVSTARNKCTGKPKTGRRGCGCPVDTSAKQKHRPNRQARPADPYKPYRLIFYNRNAVPKLRITHYEFIIKKRSPKTPLKIVFYLIMPERLC